MVISCFETTLGSISTVFGQCGQILGVLAMMVGTIARLYALAPESPTAAAERVMPMAGREWGISK